MKLAIIGLEQSGKSTVFNALTGSDKNITSFGKIEANIATIKVPDARIDELTKLYSPNKTVYADIEFIDIPGSINDSADTKIVAATREADALVFVIRSFKNESVLHPLNAIDPNNDLEAIKTGLILSDLSIAEKRVERLKVSVQKVTDKTESDKIELRATQKIVEKLENEEPASNAVLTDIEEKSIRSFQFLTLKPYLVLLNTSEDEINSEENIKLLNEIPNSMAMSARIEMEIRTLPEEERADFLSDIGIKELSLSSFILKAYSTLGLISFFTVGKDEVRAWTISKDLTAQKAAGKIHSDLERGFIRAETFSYNDLIEFGGEKEVKAKGRFRLEGKEYIVQDGDILNIKFSV
ncbi:MAG: redox-regulated ATPase YchF [Candidatus Omnitrophica bacterium]|nr:redox-regulated ATPase YchF [Candidatus Omnitrophota bacterium]